MPLSVAQYLRHLATRCSRIARDSYDTSVTKELEVISVELIERAKYLEDGFTIPAAPGESDKPCRSKP